MSFEPKKYEQIFEEMKARSPMVSDFEVGSVARTLFESFSYELALLYEKMQRVYLSGFVDTAEDIYLEQVVAVLGVTRGLPDYANGSVLFTRDAGKEDIIIPPGTLVATEETKDQQKKVYQTIEEKVLPKEATHVMVRVQALERGEEYVAPKEGIVVMPRPLPGVKNVINPEPIEFQGKRRETDEELRERAKSILISSGKATTQTIENAVLALPGITGVSIQEYKKDEEGNQKGKPGVIQVQVSGLDEDPKLKTQVEEAIHEVKAAGIFVEVREKESLGINGVISISIDSTLTPSPMERVQLEDQVASSIIALINELENGQSLQFSKVIQRVLSIDHVDDLVDFEFTTTGEEPSSYTYTSNKRIEVGADVSLGYDPEKNFIRVASEIKPLPVFVELKFTPKDDPLEEKKFIEAQLKTYFDEYNLERSSDGITSKEIMNHIPETEIDSDFLKITASSWYPPSQPEVDMLTRTISLRPSFMEKPQLGGSFVYTDHLEISGALKVVFPPAYQEGEKLAVYEHVLEKAQEFINQLNPEENLEFDAFEAYVQNDLSEWTIALEPSDFRTFKEADNQKIEVSSRVSSKQIEISALEKSCFRLVNEKPTFLIDEKISPLKVTVSSLKLDLWIAYESVPPSYMDEISSYGIQDKKELIAGESDLFRDIKSLLTSAITSEFIEVKGAYHYLDWEGFFKSRLRTLLSVREFTAFEVTSGATSVDGLTQVSNSIESTYHVRALERLEISPLAASNLTLKVFVLEKLPSDPE